MIWKFSDAYAVIFIPAATLMLLAAILCGPWWTVVLFAIDLACAFGFWWLFSRPMWPKEPRYPKE